MSTATDEQLDLLQDLDFEPACEHSRHANEHDPTEPAALYVQAKCPQCGDTARYLLCKSGWVYMGQHVVRCEPCQGIFHRDDIVWILQEL